jgi:hypothetical protein
MEINMFTHSIHAAGLLAGAALLVLAAPAAADPATQRVSVASNGRQGTGHSLYPSLSASGLSVAFESRASNLVANDTNRRSDVFVHGVRAGGTKRVSVSTAGRQGNDDSRGGVISADGRFIAFYSWASNLVPGDTNGAVDIFVHQRATATTTRVSVGAAGTQANSDSLFPALSADGRYVAFDSAASNLVAGDTNGWDDIFVRDRQSGTTQRISVANDGAQSIGGTSARPAISADGRFVAFLSYATNLVPGDTNGSADIFVRDRVAGTTRRVSVASGGAQANASSFEAAISADGRFVAFNSEAANLVAGDTNGYQDVFVHELSTGQTERMSVASTGAEGNSHSQAATLSADGRFVAFHSSAANLVPNDTNGADDVFIRDRRADTTQRVSLTQTGGQSNGYSFYPTLSADAGLVAFASTARNLVPGDTNGKFDVFVRTR